MDFNLIHSIWTVVAFVMFIAIAIWAFSGRNRKRFDDASRMPLDEDEKNSTNTERENSHG